MAETGLFKMSLVGLFFWGAGAGAGASSGETVLRSFQIRILCVSRQIVNTVGCQIVNTVRQCVCVCVLAVRL